MAHEWFAGVLNASSWHGLESVESLPDAETLIRRGEETGAWPLDVTLESMATESGLAVPGAAVVAAYANGNRIAHSAVGDRFTPLDPKEWRATVEAAVKAGAQPAGAFALRGGSRVLATFEIPGGNDGSGLRNYLCLVDALDGSLCHLAGGTTVRVVCANTLSAAMGGLECAGGKIRHTASINERTSALRKAIEAHVKRGETVRDAYKAARELRLSRAEAARIREALWPSPTDEMRKASPAKATRLENAQADAARAAARAENNEGPTLATLWNAATWLVDRTPEGAPKAARGGADKLDSLLFGSRAKRIAEVEALVRVVLADGTEADMPVTEAAAHGVDAGQIGRQLMADMLAD